MRALIIALLIVSSLQESTAQLDRYKDLTFAYSVKQFDEFIDRFNGVISKELTKEVNEANPDREKLIYSLFDFAYATKNEGLVNEFIKDATQSSQPKFLDYYNASWYAEINADYEYKGKLCQATIRLKPEIYNNYSSKWVVYQVIADDVKPNFKENDESVFLSPASNETGFINLYSFFENGFDPEAILPSNFNYDVTSIFLKEIAEGKISNFKIRHNKYHLYQIDGWYFSVSDFIRNSSNSGWLINKLQKLL